MCHRKINVLLILDFDVFMFNVEEAIFWCLLGKKKRSDGVCIDNNIFKFDAPRFNLCVCSKACYARFLCLMLAKSTFVVEWSDKLWMAFEKV
jgi:hypothetical protein